MTFEDLKPRFDRLRDVVGNHAGALGDLAAIEKWVVECSVVVPVVQPERPVELPEVTEPEVRVERKKRPYTRREGRGKR